VQEVHVCRREWGSHVGDTPADTLRKVDRTVKCRWCRWLETTSPVLHEDETFLVLAPGAERCARNRLTLLPKTHVSALTDLSPDAMVAVLAGLSKLSMVVRETCGLDDVDIHAHPADASRHHGHLHFHPAPADNPRALFGDARGEAEMGERDLVVIADALAHARGGLTLDESF
jgi:diadenosine tetraphosphate (Ap4A) HIT family hydrolase